MTLHVLTARISYGGPDRLDVTRAGADPVGVVFAPSWPLLMMAKTMARRGPDAAEAGWTEYVPEYAAEMRASYRQHRAVWDALLGRERVVLCCYCVNPARCHRRLLAGMLVECGAADEGEVAP